MQRHRINSRRNHEQGVIITVVAVFMLFVIGAMAALSIDVVTLYTARSEAQLAADAGALAGARVLANSGGTSEPNGAVLLSAETSGSPAQTIAIHVAEQNKVEGIKPTVTVTFGGTNLPSNPTVTVKVQVTNLPTFFARIWGRTTYTVGASATAEVYNPSGANALGVANPPPVAPICVKPWLLPNIDPTNSPNPIFVTATGAINNPALLGYSTVTLPPTERLRHRCLNCSGTPPLPAPVAWRYYPGNPTSFPPPTSALPSCSATPYENSIAGCVQTPIACNSTALIDNSSYFTRDTETADAVNCLTHATGNNNDADQVDPAYASPPFQFLAGDNNPILGLAGNDVMVSDSMVTVPVYDVGPVPPPAYTAPPLPPGTVTIVGFVQLFLNPDGNAAPNGGGNNGHVNTTVINMAGCGTSATGTPISGNGASPMAVRLISQ